MLKVIIKDLCKKNKSVNGCKARHETYKSAKIFSAVYGQGTLFVINLANIVIFVLTGNNAIMLYPLKGAV